jgi:hypothetical protein
MLLFAKFSLRGEQNTVVLMTIPLETHVILSSQALLFFPLIAEIKVVFHI